MLLASAWPLTKLAIDRGAAPLWLAEARAVLSCLTAAAILAARGRLARPVGRDWRVIGAVGVFQLGIYFALAHEAVAWVSAGRTTILANTTTVWVVPLSLIFLGEHIPVRRWLAVACGLGGVGVLIGPWAIDWRDPRTLIGNALLLGAALSWSVAILVLRQVRPRSGMLATLPFSFLLASLVLAPLLIAHPEGGIGKAPAAWAAVLYIGAIAGPFGTWCVLEATAALPAIVSSIGFLATPAVGLALSNLILGEAFTPDLLTGSTLILGGVALAAWPARAAEMPAAGPMAVERNR
ncbi:MAG: DMT family transporter [Rhodospirillales bacterium]|nr:DMT family transporter [Rhodospirillales bacterium]